MQLLLRKKAAEELKKEQERKAAERRRIIEERCGKPKNIEDANEGKNTFQYSNMDQRANIKQESRYPTQASVLPLDTLRCSSGHFGPLYCAFG